MCHLRKIQSYRVHCFDKFLVINENNLHLIKGGGCSHLHEYVRFNNKNLGLL